MKSSFVLALSAVVLTATLGFSAPAIADEGKGAPVPSAALYDELVAKADTGDTQIDYTALRLSYVLTDHYQPYPFATGELFQQAWKAVQEKDCKTVFEKTKELLKIDYTFIDAHAFLYDCYRQINDQTNAARELAIGRGLAASLMASGDGKTPATAYRVVTLREEGFVMAGSNAREEGQALVPDSGHMYDLLTGTNQKTGEKFSLYFQVDAPLASTAKKFGHGTP